MWQHSRIVSQTIISSKKMYWIWEPILYLWLDSNPVCGKRFISNHSFGRSTESAWNILACTKVSLSNNSKRNVILLQGFWGKVLIFFISNSGEHIKGRLADCMKDVWDKAWIRAAPSFTECHCCLHTHPLWKGREGPWSSGCSHPERNNLTFQSFPVGETHYSMKLWHRSSDYFFFIFPHFWWIASGKIVTIMIFPLKN